MAKTQIVRKRRQPIFEQNRQKILTYLINLPLDVDPPSNEEIAKAVHLHRNTVSKHCTPELWKEVLAKRRNNLGKAGFIADSALFKGMRKGSIEAVKLFYEKYENWKRKVGIDISKKHEISVKHELAGMTEEQILEYLKQDLLKMPKKLPELEEKDVLPEV